MATMYWLDKRDFGNYINFTDGDSGGVITVGTSSQIEVEYLGVPSELTIASTVDRYIADVIMWKVAQTLFGLNGKTVQYNICQNNVKATRVLANKAKSLHPSDFTLKQYDF